MEEDGGDYVVRLRGLPWATKPEDVLKFLEGLIALHVFGKTILYELKPAKLGA